MQRGKIVESGQHHQIWKHPQDAYTRTVLDAIPGRAVADVVA
jgi:peptide/nickel transport system ATP-binding protein